MKVTHIIGFASLVGALIACAPHRTSADVVSLGEGDSGRVVRAVRGQTIEIRLGSNRTTGYRWVLAPMSGGVLSALGEPSYDQAEKQDKGLGSGGVEVWKFKASQTGRQELRFEYRRPWEQNVAAAKSLSYTIETQ